MRKSLLVMFLISPVLSLYLALRDFSTQNSKLIIYLSSFFIGYTLSFSIESGDGFRHAEYFYTVAAYNWDEFVNQILLIASRTSLRVDFYTTVVNFVVSRFFVDSSFVFGIHALVFTYFYLNVILLAYDEFGSDGWRKKLFIFCLIIIFPFTTQLNALRYPIAMWAWIYGALYYLKYKKLKYVLVSLGAGLIHFGIMPASAILIIYHFMGNRITLFFGLFVVTFIGSDFFSIEQIIEMAEGLGKGIEGRATGYTNEDIHKVKLINLEKANWYVTGRYIVFKWYIILLIGASYYVLKKSPYDKFSRSLVAFTLLYGAYINLIIDIPTFGGRQRWHLWILVIFMFYRFIGLNTQNKLVNVFSWLGLVPILLYGIVEIRGMFYYLTLDTIFSNPIIVFFYTSGIPIESLFR